MIINILTKKTNNITKKIITILLKNRKKYLAHCKKKNQVRGGGRKPWKQKGTGKARAGSIRSPLWRGGGKSFGPQSLSKKYKFLNYKEKKNCINLIFILKLYYFKKTNLYFGKLLILNMNFKTQKFLFILYKSYFRNFLISKKKILILVTNYSKLFFKVLKNNKNIICINIKNISLNILLFTNKIYIQNFKIIIDLFL